MFVFFQLTQPYQLNSERVWTFAILDLHVTEVHINPASGVSRPVLYRANGTDLQPASRILPHEVHAALRFGFEPMVITVRWQDDHHALLIDRFVRLAHQFMAIGIDGQHGETVQQPLHLL